MLGKVMHYTFDAILISTILAGIRRSTGITPKVSSAKDSEVNSFLTSYLDIGEWVFDATVLVIGRSAFFERKR